MAVTRHATTTAHEPGESLAMHQFAVWRVSNGSKPGHCGDVRYTTALAPIVLQNSLLRCERAIIESK